MTNAPQVPDAQMRPDLLSVPIGAGERSYQVEKEPLAVSSTCVVYAKSEATVFLRTI